MQQRCQTIARQPKNMLSGSEMSEDIGLIRCNNVLFFFAYQTWPVLALNVPEAMHD